MRQFSTYSIPKKLLNETSILMLFFKTFLVMYAGSVLGPTDLGRSRDGQPGADPHPCATGTAPPADSNAASAASAASAVPDIVDAEMIQVGNFKLNVLSQNYYQCRSGRDATFKDDAIECSNGPQLGYVVGGESARVGSFESDLKSIENCFVGSRIYRDNVMVNQNICSTFDPATLTCLTCDNSHAVLLDSPVCFCVSDQNFVGNLSGGAGTKSCVGVIRLESAGLIELTDLILELFKNSRLYPGTVICLGSATHLHRVGATRYAVDWNTCVARLSKSFQNIQVCPLTPIPTTDCPGALAQEITYVACWFARMYGGSTLGLPDCWAKLTRITAALTTTDQVATAYATVALPVSLSPDAALTTIRFRANQIRHVTGTGLDVKATEDLVLALLTALQTTLGVDCTPRDNPVRIPAAEQRKKETIGKLVVIGASNMRRSIPALKALGYDVLDLTNLDWNGSDEAVARVAAAFGELAQDPETLDGAAIVMDLFSCISFRFSQADGGLALPMKIGGRHHLLGNLDVFSDVSLKTCVARFFPLLRRIETKNVPLVVLPPLPRYIAGGCCPNISHAPNAADPGHPADFLRKIIHLRSVLRKELTGSGLKNFWVPDPVHGMTASITDVMQASKSISDLASEIGLLMLGDNVHFTHPGYTRLAAEIDTGVKRAVRKQFSAAVIFSGSETGDAESGSGQSGSGQSTGTRTFFWRGFISRHGAVRPKSAGTHKDRTSHKASSGHTTRSSSAHPYRGRGKGGRR